MVFTRSMIAVLCIAGLSACVSNAPQASRGTSALSPALAAGNSTSAGPVGAPALASGKIVLAAQYDIEGLSVSVPRRLKVSEANTFKPRADIVWRGEAPGDRYVQVAAIFDEAMRAGTASMQQGRQVDVSVEVTRFHALTEKTRYTIGGVHEMRFILTVRDSASGQIVDGPREVVADIKAAGGAQAIAEEQAGRTQRVVTVERLASVIRRELSVQVSEEQLVSRLQMPSGLASALPGQ